MQMLMLADIFWVKKNKKTNVPKVEMGFWMTLHHGPTKAITSSNIPTMPGKPFFMEALAGPCVLTQIVDTDQFVVISTMNMTGEEIATLVNGNPVNFNFAGHVCHVFYKETGINLEA